MYSSRNITAVTVISLISIFVGIVVLISWVYNITILQTIVKNYASMKFNTALCFVLLGLALPLTPSQNKKYKGVIYLTLSFAILLVSTFSLLQYLFNFNSGLDQFFIADKISIAAQAAYPGRMPANTALCFLLFAGALIGLSTKTHFVHVFSQFSLNSITAISGIALIGYLYGLPLFYSFPYAGSMAVHTAALFFALSIIASLRQPSIGITGLFTGKLVGNVMARQLFVVVLSIVFIFGVIRIISQRRHLFSTRTGMSVLVLCFLCAGLGLVWYTVNWLNKTDTRRHEAEEKVNLMNNDLEKLVKERSGKLLVLLEKLRDSEAKFRAAFESSAIGMALISLKGKWLKVNKRFCNMVGYREQELLTMSFFDVIPIEDHDAHINLMDKALTDNKPYRTEKSYLCKNGTTVWISINISKVLNKKGGPIYFVSQFENITERKKAEANLKTAYKQIQEQVNSIKEIAWKQSHLIRSPVANLKGLTAMLEDDPSNSEALKYLNTELERLDNVLIEMAEEASNQGVNSIVVKKRAFESRY
jgi:PAS domain S-box-containing protein